MFVVSGHIRRFAARRACVWNARQHCPTIMLIMNENDNGWSIHKDILSNLRSLIRAHQRHLIENPNPQDPWWFLIDPDAEDNPWD